MTLSSSSFSARSCSCEDGTQAHTPFSLTTAEAACAPPPSLKHGDVINVALLLWIADQPHGLFQGDIADTTATRIPGYGVDQEQVCSNQARATEAEGESRSGVLTELRTARVSAPYFRVSLVKSQPYMLGMRAVQPMQRATRRH